MKKKSAPILFVLSGLLASGKSTLSKFISKECQSVYVRIDTIEQALRDLFKRDVLGEGFGLPYKIAGDNLMLGGGNVVADSSNPIIVTHNEWESVAIRNGCSFINIEVIFSDKGQHKERVKNRQSEVENLQRLTWENVQNKEYHDRNERRIEVDTANKTIEETVNELLHAIRNFLN